MFIVLSLRVGVASMCRGRAWGRVERRSVSVWSELQQERTRGGRSLTNRLGLVDRLFAAPRCSGSTGRLPTRTRIKFTCLSVGGGVGRPNQRLNTGAAEELRVTDRVGSV